jgi:hypothetical protein
MAEGLLLAWSSPASRESVAEFEKWYEEVHIPEVRAAIPSISAVERYELVDPERGPSGRFLTVYRMDDGDVAKAAAALGEGVASGRIQTTTAMDVTNDPPVIQWYRVHEA